jgi:hypothetical protein
MSPIYVPGKVVLQKEFTQQSYMWEFPAQYGLWSPANITTALWLDAADSSTVTTVSSAVSQWNDKSGNSRNATASSTERPTYSATSFNSKPGLTFNGTSNVLRADALASLLGGEDTPFSAHAVVNFSSGVLLGLGSSASNNPVHSIVALSASSLFESSRRDLASSGLGTSITGSNSASANLLLGNVFTGTSATLYRNGSQDASGAQDVGTLGTLNRFAIGALARPTVGSYATGTISEIIINTTAISTDTRQRIEGYLAHKWGLTASLPSDHPYKTVGPTP